MLTGFNTDIDFDGITYHVQTEDRGGGNPLIESLVYVRGEILAARRTEYRNLLEAGAERIAIQTLMERQHRAVVDAIRNGRIDLITEPQVGSASDTTVSRRGPASVGRSGLPSTATLARSQRTLDEVIAEWLAEQQQEERVRLVVTGGSELKMGSPFSFEVEVKTSPGDNPVTGARVSARLLSTATKPIKLAEGTTSESGSLALAGDVPKIEKGTALVVVSVQHARGNDEAKFLVKR